ncbi:MAG TPA: Ig-like domain repeat protein, partial [Rudaea sp.]|nr:Ig-like domain repeat protein [Rudaea sp.]
MTRLSWFAFWLCAVLGATPAAGAVFTPTIKTDPPISGSGISVNTSTGVITGGTGNGQISLRSAVQAANQNSGSTINLGSGTYALTIPPVMSGTVGSGNFHKAAYDNGTGLNLTGSLDIDASVTINGAGQAATIIDATGMGDRVMTINPYVVNTDLSVIQTNFTVTLQNLTVAHGNNPSDDGVNGYSAGGGIWWECAWVHGSLEVGSLVLTSVTLDHNATAHGGGAGGVVLFNGGAVTITGSSFTNNSVTGAGQGGGGAIAVTNSQTTASTSIVNTLSITNSTFTGNTCQSTSGGAIEVVGGTNAYHVDIHSSTFQSNSAAYGGAIQGTEPLAHFVIDQGTQITGNSATTGAGGGVFVDSNISIAAGTVITGNSAALYGGGISIGSGSTVTLSDISNNTAGTTAGGIYFFSGGDASLGLSMPSVSFSRIVGNTATLGANQIDGADVPNSLVDNWLGANLPGPNDIGFNNAVPISAIGPQSGGAGSPVTATTSRPHGFFAGQMVGIEGVANGAYGGNIGVCGTTTPFPGITNVTATTFQYCGAATNPQPASSGGYVNQAWQVQTAQESGNTVTLTGVHTPQGFGDAGDSNMRPMESGDLVHVWGISNAGYNGVYVVTGFNATAHTLTYTAPTSGLPTLNNLDNGSQIGNAIAMPKNIVTTSESGSTVTINTNGAHGLAVGNVVLIGGVGVAGYNGVFIVTSVASTSFTYTNTTSGLASSTTGSFAKLEDSGLQWNLSAAPNLIRIGDTSTLTGSFLTDSAGNSVSTANLAREVGKPVTWASGSLGTLSGQQTTVQSGGTATATFTSTAGGLDHPTAQVDSQTATTLVTVLFPPQISKSFSATHIADNGVATLTFTITNQNTTHGLNGLAFTDNLPAGLKVAAAPNASTTCTGGAVSATAGSGTISLSGGTLSFNAAGTLTCTVSVDVRGAVDGVQNNVTGSVTATDLGGMTGNTGSASITVINPPTIAKSFTPNSIPFGATSTLTLTVSSSNVNETLNGVAFTDNLPSGMTVASPSNLNNTCGGSATTPTTSRVALSGVTLAAGATCQVTLTVVATPVGTYNNSVSITSTDFGGLTGNTANASLAVTKANTTTAIASSSNPSAFGKPVTFTATVTDSSAGSTAVPTGTVQFVVDGVNFGSPVALTAASSTSATATSQATATLGVNASPHTVTANYVNADGNFNNSSGTLTGGQTITPASTATAVASSINPSTFGQSVKFTATVTDTAAGSSAVPTGAVQFVVDGANFGTPVTLVSGSATSASTTTLSASGSPHTVTANFVNADGNFSNSTGTLTGGQNVAPASTSTGVTSSQNPSVINQSVTFTATITNSSTAAVPTGSVQFVVDGANFGSPVALAAGANTAQSQATTTLSVAGSPHSVTANYSNADGNFNNSSGSLVGGQTVTKAITTTAISTSAGTIALGDTVTFTATVAAGSNTAQGIVTFFDGATPIGSATLNGVAGNDQAAFTTSLLSATGSPHAIKATFEDTASFAGSTSATIGETVNPRTSATGVVVNPTAVVVQQASTATVTVTDSGSVPPGAADTFASTGAPASGRTGFTATLFGDGLALVAGGTDANNNVLNGAEVYNVSGASFTSVGNLNTARTGAVAVLLPNGKVLVAGGSSDGTANGALKTAELFDPNTGTFTATSHAMNAARLGATAVLLKNGKVLLAGGIDSGGVLNTAELYDATADTFTATGNLNAARSGASATLLGSGKVLLAGGSSDGTANGALNSAEVFDPAGNAGAGTFAAVAGTNASLGVARWQPEAALLLSGKVLVAGGVNSGGALTSADLYDPVADSFTASGEQMSQARAGGTAVALPSGMVLLAGGTTSQAVDLYDEDSDQFNMTGSLQQSDAGLQSVLLNNGQVLVVGLTTSATPASDAELYAPSFNPLGTVVVTSSEGTDAITGACVLTPSTSTASTCTATVTPANVATSPHTITGTYPADGVHASSSNTASLILNKTDTSTSVTSATNPSVFGQSVTFTATVASLGSGTPSGTVTFLDGGNIIGSGSLGAGTATFTTSALAAGSHTITAHYGGDGNFNTSDGSMTGNPQVVTSANSTTTATSTANPSVFG